MHMHTYCPKCCWATSPNAGDKPQACRSWKCPSMQFSRNFKKQHVFPAHANVGVLGQWSGPDDSCETSTFREEEKELSVERLQLPPSLQINSSSFSVHDTDLPLHKPKASKEGWAGGPGPGPGGCADKYLQCTERDG